MSKTQAASTFAVRQLEAGMDVFHEHVQEVIEQLNWSFGYRPQVHLNQAWGDETVWGNEMGAHHIDFGEAPLATYRAVIRGDIRVQPEVVNLVVAASCDFDTSGDDGDVKFVVGSATTTLNFTDADNDAEKKTEIATSSSGTGWLAVEIDIRANTLNGLAVLRHLSIQDEAITSSLPDPPNE